MIEQTRTDDLDRYVTDLDIGEHESEVMTGSGQTKVEQNVVFGISDVSVVNS